MGLKNNQMLSQGAGLYGPPVGLVTNNNSGILNSSGIDQSTKLDPRI